MVDERSMTAEESLAPEYKHCELIRGRIVTRPLAGFERATIAGNIACMLMPLADHRKFGIVVSAPTGFQIGHDPDTVRVCDVAFVRTNRIPPGGIEGFFQGPPDIAVEVVSPSDRASEVLAKVQDWLDAGCGMVWVVDPETRTVTVYRSRRNIAMVTIADTLNGGSVLPGLAMPVADIFAQRSQASNELPPRPDECRGSESCPRKDSHSADTPGGNGPFQYSLRSMFVLTFVVALFCSAATTFQGAMRTFAVVALAWLVAGGLYWKWRLPFPVLIVHAWGPVVGVLVCWGAACQEGSWEDWWADVPTILLGAFVPTIPISALFALRFRLWS
ncbi:MAG: Uma2 family endonuclease [Thermoguttaceae bacterium]